MYLLNQEVEALRQRVEELERDGVPGNEECSRTVGRETTTFAHGTFMRFSDQMICYCSVSCDSFVVHIIHTVRALNPADRSRYIRCE